MRWIRSRLARAAAGWLVVHVCLLLSVPTALCTTMSVGAKAECTCDHGDGQMCPMHHTRSKSKTPLDPHSCSCRSTSDPVAAMAAALIGPAGVIVTLLPATEPT